MSDTSTMNFVSIADALKWADELIHEYVPPNSRFIVQVGPRWPGDQIYTWKCHQVALPKALLSALKWRGETRVNFIAPNLGLRDEFAIFFNDMNVSMRGVSLKLDYSSDKNTSILEYTVTEEPECPMA